MTDAAALQSLNHPDTPLPRSNHATVNFDNRMWVIGGEERDGGLKNDVWYSTDGNNWTCANVSAGFPKSYNTQAFVYNGRIWVIGGHDVWYSADGTFWTRATDAANFPGGGSILTFDNRIWVIGSDGDGWKNDVWYSSNGVNWTAANLSAAFRGRDQHTAFVFDNRMWIGGGMNGPCGESTNDIWSSPDGIIWTQVVTGPEFTRSSYFSSLIYNNRIWIFDSNNVWQSPDGVSWTLMNSSVFGPSRYSGYYSYDLQNKLVYNDRMWVISGDNYGWGDDVWSSPDGTVWTRVDTTKRIWPRTEHSAAVFHDNIWLIGGVSRDRYLPLNDTWYSGDGAHWSKGTASAGFSPRKGHSSVAFDNKLWVIAGEVNYDDPTNEVWYSDDGTNWQSANISAAFSPRHDQLSVVFDKRMWVIGGLWGTPDVWYSADGKFWTCANTSVPPLQHSNRQSAVVFNDHLWIVGGVPVNGSENEYNLASWYSADGSIWHEANESLPFVMGARHSLASYNGRMWIFTWNNEVWSSADGIIWEHTGNFPTPSVSYRKEPIVLVYDNKLWAIGGDESEWLDDAWFSTDGVSWTRAGDSTEMPAVDNLAREHRHGDSVSVMCGPY
ncbi:MAG: kelch repeat-containing protein [Patulibacter sp.]